MGIRVALTCDTCGEEMESIGIAPMESVADHVTAVGWELAGGKEHCCGFVHCPDCASVGVLADDGEAVSPSDYTGIPFVVEDGTGGIPLPDVVDTRADGEIVLELETLPLETDPACVRGLPPIQALIDTRADGAEERDREARKAWRGLGFMEDDQ